MQAHLSHGPPAHTATQSVCMFKCNSAMQQAILQCNNTLCRCMQCHNAFYVRTSHCLGQESSQDPAPHAQGSPAWRSRPQKRRLLRSLFCARPQRSRPSRQLRKLQRQDQQTGPARAKETPPSCRACANHCHHRLQPECTYLAAGALARAFYPAAKTLIKEASCADASEETRRHLVAQSSTQVQKRLKYEETVLQARNLQRKTDECTSAQLDHSPSLSDSERTYRGLRDMV